MWAFDDFEPGERLGEAAFIIDEDLVRRWLSLYANEPDPRPAVPAGMANLVVMRGYAQAVRPRPPGNVHASQSLTVERVPRVGECLTTTIRCDSKQIRNGRRWVRFGFETANHAGRVCYRGVITSVWSQ